MLNISHEVVQQRDVNSIYAVMSVKLKTHVNLKIQQVRPFS